MAEEFDKEILDVSAETLKGKLFSNMNAKERLKICSYMIEATDNEQANLWLNHFEDLNWQQLASEYICVGHVNGNKNKPINVKLTWARFQTLNTCFYYTDTCNFETVNKWIDLHYSGPRTNADNFKECINTICSLVEVRKPV